MQKTIVQITLNHILSTNDGKHLLPDMLDLCINNIMSLQLNEFINKMCHLDFEQLMNEPSELCGTANFTDLKLIRLTIHKSNKKLPTNRQHCIYKYYDNIIWHTHLFSSKIYPSVEDVFQLLHSPNIIHNSIIICAFGYFLMVNDSFILKMDIENITQIVEQLNKQLYEKIYKNKNVEERLKFHKTHPLPNIIKTIENYAQMLTEKISIYAPTFKIKFYQIKFIKKIETDQYLLI